MEIKKIRNQIDKKIENNLTHKMIVDSIVGKPDENKSYVIESPGRLVEYVFDEDISKKSKKEMEDLIRNRKYKSIRRDEVKF